eukprot:4561518-Amphidinium_carterae.1
MQAAAKTKILKIAKMLRSTGFRVLSRGILYFIVRQNQETVHVRGTVKNCPLLFCGGDGAVVTLTQNQKTITQRKRAHRKDHYVDYDENDYIPTSNIHEIVFAIAERLKTDFRKSENI